MRMTNWAALGIAAGMSHCSLMAAPATQLASPPAFKATIDRSVLANASTARVQSQASTPRTSAA